MNWQSSSGELFVGIATAKLTRSGWFGTRRCARSSTRRCARGSARRGARSGTGCRTGRGARSGAGRGAGSRTGGGDDRRLGGHDGRAFRAADDGRGLLEAANAPETQRAQCSSWTGKKR